RGVDNPACDAAINSLKDCKNRPFDGLLRLVMLLSRASNGGASSGVEDKKNRRRPAMRNVRKLGIAAAVTLAMFIATAARAQVLTMVPTDAMVVIKIKNMQDVSAKVAALSQQWGLANIRPELNDPLGTALTAVGLGAGMNKNGEAAVAMLKPAP